MTLDELLSYDQKHLWHPYTSLKNPLPAFAVKSAKGVHLHLEDGRSLIDGMSSWWCAVHGYSHPKLIQAIKNQAEQMSHIMFGGITHRPAVELAKRLLELSPKGIECVFLADSGSVSVEVSLKMAIQYQLGKGRSNRKKIMSLKGGYHGDTFGAMSVCDPISGMHHLFNGVLPQQVFAPKPSVHFDEELSHEIVDSYTQLIQSHSNEIAAFILEPVVQGAGGMNIYSPKLVKLIYDLCKQEDILFIADEIATGFGRTGELFACNHANITPDIMCIGKALTGGMMTMAAAICTREVAETVSDHEPGVLMHGPTFMGNPLAASVACASLDLLIENDWKTQVSNIENWLNKHFHPLTNSSEVKDVRILGAIAVVECQHQIDVAAIQKHFVNQGIWVRPFRNLIYVMPPFISEEQHIEKLAKGIVSYNLG